MGWLYISTAAVAMALSCPSLLAAQDCPPTRRPVTIFFGNGVLAVDDVEDIQKGTGTSYTTLTLLDDTLRERVEETDADVHIDCITMELAFNRSGGVIPDLFESAVQ